MAACPERSEASTGDRAFTSDASSRKSKELEKPAPDE